MAHSASIEPDHLPEKEKAGYIQAGLIISPLCSVGLLFLALLQLGIGGGSVGGWIKAVLIALAAFVVSYAIYRMAIEKSAPQSTRGYRSSLLTGGITTFLVGLTFFIATAAGLIIAACEELVLQDHNEAVIAYTDARGAQAAQSARLVPVVQAISADLTSKAECEIASSCVSGRGVGGYGSTARMLETLADRAAGIADEAKAGLAKRDALLDELDGLIERMDTVLADETHSIWDRRHDLRKLDGELGRVLNALDEAVPVALMAAYAGELLTGVSMPNARVSDTINGLLRGYAGSIDAVLGGIVGEQVERPAFPPKVGALQSFEYAPNFAPVILIAFLVDMVFPLALWIYTLNGLDWAAFIKNPSRKRTKRARTAFDDLAEYQVMDPPKTPNGRSEPRPPQRTNSRNRRH